MHLSPKSLSMYMLALILLGAGYVIWYDVGVRNRSSSSRVTNSEIIASFYPWKYFTEQIAGNPVNISSLVPAGVEPHDYEPSIRDTARIYDAQLVILNGGGFEPWADRLSSQLKDNSKMLNVAEEIGWLNEDPHFWLDPIKAREAILKIKDRLVQVDTRRASQYEAGAKDLSERLSELDAEYQKQLENCEIRAIITPHDAFSYLASKYKIQTLSLVGASPEAEPSPRQINSIISQAKLLGIRAVFFEPLIGDSLAMIVAKNIGGSVVPLNPIETLTQADEQAGQDYFTIMRENLVNLRRAMVCQ